MIADRQILLNRVWEFIVAPVQHPDIVSSIIPLVLGAFIIELYFGKHTQEVLGWNTSVGNAIIWISTGFNLLLNSNLETPLEQAVTYFILLSGAVIAYMDFFHKWSNAAAFRASSPDVIYPLAYVAVVIIKTDIIVNILTIKAAIAFVVGTVIFFRILRLLETPAPDEFQDFRFRY